MGYLDNFTTSYDPGMTPDQACLLISENKDGELVYHAQLHGNDAKVLWDIISAQGRRLESIEKRSRSSKGRCRLCGADKHDFESTGTRHFQSCVLGEFDE